MRTGTFNAAELEALLDIMQRYLENARRALERQRNPSSPSHCTAAMAARVLGVTPARVRQLVQGGKLTEELHHGTKLIPTWSVMARKDAMEAKP